MERTIVAISTALGNGGISIIRLSGKDSSKIADQVFFHKNLKVSEFDPRKLYLGKFQYGDIQDKCMCVYFRAPFSYTGEDVVEFQCHGGVTLTQKIYESLINIGATPATKGEFSKLAFLNGKLSLDEAEGVIDIINAESESELKAGYNLMHGGLKRQVETMQTSLTEMLAKLEVTLDYPEEDLEEETTSNLISELSATRLTLENLLSTSRLGHYVKEGTKILLLGKTNAGKSSLLNALLNYERAIVTDVRGTTRDTLEETYQYKGFKFLLIDSAGIRNSEDVVEKVGIRKSLDKINEADIILFVVDGSEPLDNNDYDIISKIKDKNAIVVVNKSDLSQKAELDKLPFKTSINISTKTGENIDNLKELLYSMVTENMPDSNAIIITNTRHIEALKSALAHLDQALLSLQSGLNLDLTAIDLKNVWLSLGDITGTSDNEKIIDDIFSKFCVGK